MTDYLIVGSGLAGIAFVEQAINHGKSVLVFDDASRQSSRIAGGLYNPVILKRFSGLSDAQEQLDSMSKFYNGISKKLHGTFHHPMSILRKFTSVEEQNNWFAATDKPSLSPFLSAELVFKKFNHITAPFGFGRLMQTGYADTEKLLEAYHEYLSFNGWLLSETFNHAELKPDSGSVIYKSIKAKNIIFAEGFGIKSNPFFNYLPLDGTKGELFTIRAKGLDLDVIIKSTIFIVPLGDDFFKVGATYEWNDKTESPTEEGKNQLIEMIKETIDCEFEIISHLAGIRPTVKDRKPLLGTHHEYKNLHILNGMGTRGVMLAPKMAEVLFNHIESGSEIPRELDIKRFTP